MMKGLRLVPDVTNINFIGARYVAYMFTAVLILGSIFLISTKGLNFGIDFTGGTVIEIRTPVTPDLGELRAELNGLGLGAISIQEFGEPDDLLIRLPQQQSADDDGAAQKDAIEMVRSALDARYADSPAGVEYRRVEFVGPQVGKELKEQGALAVLFSILAITAYVWFRFEWQFGVSAVVALLHDSIATIGLFALTGMEFNLSTVAAVLMVAGYSINDTVVVFDRIRETLRKYKKKPLGEVFNLAINETLSRTLMTSFTTVLALFALYLFGGPVIQGFVYALIFGIAVGTFSSIFVAAPVLLIFKPNRGDGADSEAVAQEA